MKATDKIIQRARLEPETALIISAVSASYSISLMKEPLLCHQYPESDDNRHKISRAL